KQGHFPEALVGLADVEIEKRHDSAARERLLAALDLKKPIAEGATPPLQLANSIIARLTNLEPVTHCKAWVATLPGSAQSHQAFKNTAYLIFAPSQPAAHAIIKMICSAMDPDFPASALMWKDARRDQQPARPVHPGI